jgi:transposase-like protein
MKTISTYSVEFKEQALSKVLSRGNRTVQSVADELHMNVFTLKNWMKKVMPEDRKLSLVADKRPQDWSREEQLMALHESHGLQGEALSAWCRSNGLFAHHLESWKASFCAGNKEDGHDAREWRSLKDENRQLKRELLRKEKALAAAAALLVLQKKFQALWEGEEK